MARIVAVGACYLDTILTVSHYPAEDDKLRASSLTRRRGGNCPNTLEVLQQLQSISRDSEPELLLSLFAVLPSRSSPGAAQIESSFQASAIYASVDLTSCLYREESLEPASSYIIKSRSTDSRTIVNFNNLPEMTKGEFVRMTNELGSDACWYHFEGRIPTVTLECIQHVRRRFPNSKISVEAEKPGREGLQSLAAAADVVFYSKSWAQGQGYSTLEECLRAQSLIVDKPSLLCCTWGREGAAALELPTQRYTHCPAYVRKEQSVVDTIGAGDTFIAGMLYGLICRREEWDIDRKVGFANELAGRKVVREGFEGLGHSIREGFERLS